VVDPSAYVAPTAVVCGDVHVAADARVLFGAVVTAEDGRVDVGARSSPALASAARSRCE
jgi:carbonic anhydrase/acetyltransferase-like protein (isoleucine patch superfamily)